MTTLKALKTLCKIVARPILITLAAGALALPAKAQLVSPRWGYLSPSTNLTASAAYAPTPTNVQSLNGAIGKTNQVLDVFRDRGVTLWLPVTQTNQPSLSSNTVVYLDTTANDILWTTNDIVWTFAFRGTNFVAKTNLTDAALGDIKRIRLSSINCGVTNPIGYGPLQWSITP